MNSGLIRLSGLLQAVDHIGKGQGRALVHEVTRLPLGLPLAESRQMRSILLQILKQHLLFFRGYRALEIAIGDGFDVVLHLYVLLGHIH